MFQMISNRVAYEPPYAVSLRCECGDAVLIDTDNFKEVTETYVILKKNAKVTCPKCGKSQPRNERFIPQEPQIIRNPPQPPQPPKKDDFEFLISAIDWNTWD